MYFPHCVGSTIGNYHSRSGGNRGDASLSEPHTDQSDQRNAADTAETGARHYQAGERLSGESAYDAF